MWNLVNTVDAPICPINVDNIDVPARACRASILVPRDTIITTKVDSCTCSGFNTYFSYTDICIAINSFDYKLISAIKSSYIKTDEIQHLGILDILLF